MHIVGSSVNLPDMSAALKAKVAVSDADQADPGRMASVYDSMAAKFAASGLSLPAVHAVRQYFTNLSGPGPAEALHYGSFPTPLPPNAVRLCVIFFQQANPHLASLVHQAAQEVMQALPPGTKVHVSDPGHYHITTYMTSQPHTIRPNPFDPGAALPETLTPDELMVRAAPDPAIVQREVEIMRKEASITPAPRFKVHRLLLADSGTLLLCSVDVSGVMAGLRRRLRDAFPGGPPRQSTIFHASLARIVSPEELSPQTVARVQAVCDGWSERLRGMEFRASALHHVIEEVFTTVEGPVVRLPFQGET